MRNHPMHELERRLLADIRRYRPASSKKITPCHRAARCIFLLAGAFLCVLLVFGSVR